MKLPIIGLLLLYVFLSGGPIYATGADDAARPEASKLNQLLEALETSPIEEHPGIFLKLSKLYRNVDRAQAWTYALKGRDLADSLGNKKKYAEALTKVGSLYSTSQSPAEALACFLEALPILQELADSLNMAGVYLNIGIVYGNQERPEESAKHFELARSIFKKLGKQRGEALALNNLGLLAQNVGKYDTALAHLTESLALFTLLGETNGVVTVLNNIAENKLLRGHPDEAWPFLEESASLDSSEIGTAENLYLASRVSEVQKNLGRAIRYANQGLEKASKVGATEQESKLNILLYRLYKKRGKYELASIHQEAYSANLKRLYKAKNDQAIEYLELQSELKHQQTENSLLRKSKELKATELRRRTQLTLLTGLAFLLIGVLALVLYRNLSRQRYTNEKLMKLNGQISHKNKEIGHKTEQLLIANQELESFNFAVSHDLKTPLRSIFSFYQLLQRNWSDQLDQDGMECLDQIGLSARQMQGVISSLLALSKVNQHEIDRQLVDVGNMAGEIIGSLASDDDFSAVHFSTSGNLYAMADTDLIKILLTNLIGNSFKYANDKRELRLRLSEKNGVYSLSDNGIGFEQQYADRIFKAFQRLHSIDEFEGSGVGLATVERIVRKHSGKIWAEGELGKGASFYFTLGDQSKLHLADSSNAKNIAGEELPTSNGSSKARSSQVVEAAQAQSSTAQSSTAQSSQGQRSTGKLSDGQSMPAQEQTI